MTNKQIQFLLAYLGYYVGEIDGIFGQLSATATKAFQADFGIDPDGIAGPVTQKSLKHAVAYGMPAKKEFSWDDIKYFKRPEFKCKCGKYCDGFPVEMNEQLLRIADRVREHFGKPMIVSSGVRCETHNANVGGATGSRHKLGKAMDFCVDGFSASSVLAYVQTLPDIRYSYAIDSNYVHMDVL